MKKQTAAGISLDSMTDNIAYSLPQVIFEIDQSGRIVFVNRSAFDAFGYTEDDFVQGLNVFQMVIPEDVDRAAEAIRERFRGEGGNGIELTARRKDGSTFPVIISSNPIVNKDGAPGLVGIILDISKQKEIEQKLRESEENYRSIFDAASDAIYVHDLETGRILDVNRRMCEMFKTTLEEALSLSMDEGMVGEGRFTPENAMDMIARAAAGEPQVFEWLAKDRHGRRFWVEVNLST